ncbi:MAG: hypothetical protein QXS51_05835 [Thermoproteota archaeon]|nr:hypothetical protein [Candidatus Brockarchaeota archaeon]
MPPEEVRPESGVRIKKGELEVEVWGSREFVESTLEKLKEEFFKKEVLVTQTVKPSSPSMTFTEYLAEEAKVLGREPDTLKGYEKILLIGYYIYTTENRDFTYEDIERLKTEARLSGLENPRQYMGVLIRKGYVSETGTEGGKKVFRMLRRGLQYVESGFREAEA